jgi:hypothetical protein
LRDLRLRVVGHAYFLVDTFAKIRAAHGAHFGNRP